MPRHINGRFHLMCAAARSLWAASAIVKRGLSAFDVIFVDQISLSIPILRLTNSRVGSCLLSPSSSYVVTSCMICVIMWLGTLLLSSS
jgi:hypothetical protein